MLSAVKNLREKSQIRLPLVDHERMGCSTCHNPHAGYAIRSIPALKAKIYSKRLRMPAEQLCFVCHKSVPD